LHQWATGDTGHRSDGLFNLVYDPAFLMNAWHRVAGNTGARTAGIERETVAWIEARIGVPEFLNELRDRLKDGRFAPVEVGWR
jgi:RNA-directed DNA polymerase